MIHLSVIVMFLFGLTWCLRRSGDHAWFGGRDWPEGRRRLATAVALVTVVTAA
jgi:hypothetical protein